MDVAFFVTCLTDHFYPRVAIAAVKLLEHFGCTVHFPAQQTCCGQPMYNNGLHDEARALARNLIRVLEPYPTVVTPSASCASMLRAHFADLLEDDAETRQAAQHLARRTYELYEFLVNVLKVNVGAANACWRGRVTYHAACHLRTLGIQDEAERLLTQVREIEYVPLNKAEQCCGFGGTFALHYPDISGALVRDKVECIRATGAEALVCNEAGCTMNIAGACRRYNVSLRVLSLAELLAEALGLLERPAATRRAAMEQRG